jgi:hypothetical protein
MGALLRAIVVAVVAVGCLSFEPTQDASTAISLVGISGATASGGNGNAAASGSTGGTSGSALGASCTGSSECASGFCADGVCCNEACGESCVRCDGGTAGTCHAVTGSPAGSHAACAASAAICGGTCDGVSRQCSYPGAGTRCGSNCDGTCAGDGSCTTVGACANGFACLGSSCASACASNGDCAPNFECASAPNCTRVPEANCLNGVDDNGDGLADCQDPTCLNAQVECVDDPASASAIGYVSSNTTCDAGYAPTTLNGSPGPNSGACSSACTCTPPVSQHAMSLDDYPLNTSCSSTHGSNAFTLYSNATFRICIYAYAPGIQTDSILIVSQSGDSLVSACSTSNLSGTTTPPAAMWGNTRSFCGVTSKNGTCPVGKSCVWKQAQKHCALYGTATACSGAYSASGAWFTAFGADNRTCTACNALGCTATPQTLSSVTIYPHSTTCPAGGSQYLANTINTIGISWPNANGSCYTGGAPAACSHNFCWDGPSTTLETFTASSSWSGGSCSINSSPVITGGAVAGTGAQTTCCEP